MVVDERTQQCRRFVHNIGALSAAAGFTGRDPLECSNRAVKQFPSYNFRSIYLSERALAGSFIFAHFCEMDQFTI